MNKIIPVHPTDHALDQLKKRLGPGMNWRDVLNDSVPGNPWLHIKTLPGYEYRHHPRWGLLFVLAKTDNGYSLVTVRKPRGEALTIAHEEHEMNSATRPQPMSPTGFRLEWVAGGLNAKDPIRQRDFDSHGSRDLLTQTLTKAGIPAMGRRVQVIRSFVRASDMPPVSGILADKHGVRLRIKPKRYDQGFMTVVLCESGETPESLASRLEPAARAVSGGVAEEPLPDPESELVYRRAADIAGELDSAESLPGFADNVAAEMGPGMSAAYAWKALCAAETAGLLYRNGTAFLPVESPPEPEPETLPVAPVPGSSAAHPHNPMPVAAPPPTNGSLDMTAVEILANNAGALAPALSRIQKLNDTRKNLLKKRAELDLEIATNAAEFKKEAKAVNLDEIMLALDALRGD